MNYILNNFLIDNNDIILSYNSLEEFTDKFKINNLEKLIIDNNDDIKKIEIINRAKFFDYVNLFSSMLLY